MKLSPKEKKEWIARIAIAFAGTLILGLIIGYQTGYMDAQNSLMQKAILKALSK